MSRPYRNRTRYRQHPYKNREKSVAVKQEKCSEDTDSSSCPSGSSSDHGGDRLKGWDYLLRRKAEHINDRILKSKVSESYGGTNEVFSQFVPKQEPSSPTTDGPSLYASQHIYDGNESFWFGTRGERNSQHPEARQTFPRLTNAHQGHRNVKIESPWGYPENESHNFIQSGAGTSHFKDEHFVTDNSETNIANQGRHLTVEKLISNIRSAVASNPNFRRNKQDSASIQTSNGKIQDNVSDASLAVPTFGANNIGTHSSEKTLNCHMPYNTGHEVTHHATMDNGEGNQHDSTANQTSNIYYIPKGSGNVFHATKPDCKRNDHNPVSGKTLIHSLPYPAEGVEVVYTIDPVEVEAWLKNKIIDCSAQAVGLDIEWKPQFVSKKKGGVENKTAVLQLGVEGSCLVLHLCRMKSTPTLLKNLLRNRKILKVGSGILQDVTKLRRDTGLRCEGMMDTQKMAKSMGIPVSQKLGLKALANRFLGIDLEKPKSVSMSNWEKYPLTLKQIHYAALDAWIGFKIYQHMKMVNGEDQALCIDDEKPAEIVQCKVCGKKVKGEDALATHSRIHPQCKFGQFFVSKISKTHKKKCPAIKTVTPPQTQTAGDDTVWCQGCGKKCKNEDVLMKHIRDVGHVQCPFCNRLLQGPLSTKHIQKCKNIMDKN